MATALTLSPPAASPHPLGGEDAAVAACRVPSPNRTGRTRRRRSPRPWRSPRAPAPARRPGPSACPKASPPQVGADPGTARGRGGLFPAAPMGLFSRSLPAGSPSLYQPPGQEKEVLAAPPAGLQMAPCGCFFDPRIYHIEWATTSFLQPPVYKLGGGAAPPGTFLLDAQRYLHAAGPPDPFAPYQQLPGAPRYAAPYALPEDGVAPAVAFPGDNAGGRHSADGSPEPAGCSPPSRQPADLPEQVLLEDAMKLFDCSLAAELSPEELSGILTRGGRPGADGFFLREDAARDIGSLWLPEELLSSDYSVPETLNTVLSMDCFYAVKVAPEEPGWDAGNGWSPKIDTPRRGARAGAGWAMAVPEGGQCFPRFFY
uniref:Uncharacterized protein n=1 Tax=Dromaius novaehollandiae TaxID=8790 RepID=A0A8C4KHX7_DRONO